MSDTGRDQGEAFHLVWELSRSSVEEADGLRVVVMATLRAVTGLDGSRAPLNLSLVLDRSGSMAGEEMAYCCRAARFVVSQLTEKDHLSVVAFDDDVEVLVRHEPVTAKDRILALLDGVEADGGTNLSGGWMQGAALVERVRRDDWVNRVLLLTDGGANVGVTGEPELVSLGKGLRTRGVSTTTVGFGPDFCEELLQAVASASGGNFHYIRAAEDAPGIFARELGELLTVAAQNARLVVSPSIEVELIRVMNDYPNRKTSDGLEIELGDILCGEAKHVLLEFVVPTRERSRRGVSVLTLTYQQVKGGVAFRELTAFVQTPSEGVAAIPVNPTVWREVILVEAAQGVKEARQVADEGKVEEAREKVMEICGVLEASSHAQEPDFVKQREELEQLSRLLQDKGSYAEEGRKALTYHALSLSQGKLHTRGGALCSEVRTALIGARRVVVLVGNTMAFDGGLPRFDETPFEDEPPARLACVPSDDLEAFRQWRWMVSRQDDVAQCGPGTGHEVIDRLRERWEGLTIATTGTDGLLGWSGHDGIVELFGCIWQGRCTRDGAVWDVSSRRRPVPRKLASWQDGRPICACGTPLRPHVSWPREPVLGEAMSAVMAALDEAQLLIVVGTKALWTPSSRVVDRARARSIPILSIGDFDAPSWTTQHLTQPCHEGLVQLETELSER